MRSTLTVRTDEAIREALARRAEALGTTVSEVVRRILEDALVERPLRARVGHLRGDLELPIEPPDSWRREIEDRNRRG